MEGVEMLDPVPSGIALERVPAIRSGPGAHTEAAAAWIPSDDEDGWMPKPARLHSGNTRSCAVCFAWLQSTAMTSWDAYLESDEYLDQVQANVLQDAFMSSLLCGDTPAGDLPTEHRMHPNRKWKCRQTVRDYQDMTSAGVVDETVGRDKGPVRTLDEMLLEALPTPVFTHVLERRLAVVAHSAQIACKRLTLELGKKTLRPVELAPGNEELQHVALHTLTALLGAFDYKHSHARRSFQELSQLLTCFPVLSLYSCWSPVKKPPETVVRLNKEAVEASSVTASSDAHGAHCALDGRDDTFWQSQPRPGVVFFVVKGTAVEKVTSISIHWHMKCSPQTVGVQYRPDGSDKFLHVVEDQTVSPSGPTVIETNFPMSCREARIVMAGTPSSNRNGTYAIDHLQLNMPTPGSLFADPNLTLSAIAHWLLAALDTNDEVMAAEAIGALKAWALSTASLNVTLLFVDMLLQLDASAENPRRCRIAALALKEGRLLLKGIDAYHQQTLNRLAHAGDPQVGFDDIRRVAAVFESSVCSTGVVVEDDGLAVRTQETSYQYAAVSCGISTGKASWKLRLDTDTQDDEMTCFGAAILPVTISGYDSSPSLWMLRGYNGNLYARGRKLGRTIGKVHPGDIVQVDVDMSEGTLAYKINDTDYGVVFADLAGHEVYPAVSFYGSGKVITLLGVTKWDCGGSGPANADSVFLSSMRETHFSVGYGTLGKGGQLGYASNGDPSTCSGNNTSVTGSTSIHINGEAKHRCLSTHPPSHGDAYVNYDLSEAYHTTSGAVAINDDTRAELFQNHGAFVEFKIFGDDKLLWQSKPMSGIYIIEQFEVDVKNVRLLELRVSCQGSNHCAHAIWVDPCLHPVEEWACVNCSFVNHGSAKVCPVCRNGTRDKSLKMVEKLTSEDVINKATPIASVRGEYVQNLESLSELGTAIVRQIYGLYQVEPKRSSAFMSSAKSSVQFEEPFCRQPSKEVFSLLLTILQRFHSNSGLHAHSSNVEKHNRDGFAHILGIISANLESIACHDVKDPAAEVSMLIELVADLRGELETIAQIREAPQRLADEIEKAAAQTIVAGISVLYPSAIEKLQLLLQLLRSHIVRPMDVTSASYFVLASVMRLLAAPGYDGILNLMPHVAANINKCRGSISTETDQAAWVLAVTDTVQLVMQVVVNAHRKQLLADIETLSEADLDRNELSDAAVHLLKTYQLYLLSEAVDLTKTKAIDMASANQRNAKEMRSISQRRLHVQEATLQFGFLSLNAYRDLIDSIVAFQAEASFVLSQAAAARQASVRSYKIPLLSEVLPWFVACLCLLRRHTWLARQILPATVRLLETLDHFCSESPAVTKSAHRFQQLEAHQKARLIELQEMERGAALEKEPSFRSHTTKRLYNVFHQLYTGDKDHFEGQIGFQFEATSSFTIVALGRSVNPNKHSGRLTREHLIRLWEEGSQQLVAQVTVGGSSKKDALGYALEMLSFPVKITQGKLYRLTTQEFANGGDPWYKKENLPDEEYDESFIKILRDCYASGSVEFPGSQNMMGAAYGVPTFMIQDETSLASLPRFVPPHGCLSLRFNTKKKLGSVCISHTGTSAYVKDSTDTWRTCLLRTSFLHGVHSVDFALTCSRAGGTVSGHVCIGIDWRQPQGECRLKSQLSDHETFMGETPTSIGWMPSIGSVWVGGTRYDYGPKLLIGVGDIFTVVIDYDLQLLSFAYNGKNLGVAVGPKEFRPLGIAIEGLPRVVTAGVSLYGSHDVVQVRPSGIAKSSLRIHWLFDLHNSLASLAGRIASALIAGHPVDGVEEELLPWLQSPLLSGGIAEPFAGQDQSGMSMSLLWSDVIQAECARYPANDRITEAGVLTGLSQNTLSSIEKSSASRKRGSGRHLNVSEAVSQRDPAFWGNWTADMTERGTVQLIMSWLERHCPDRTFLSRLGRFPLCERWMCAALIMHAPSHVLQEVQAIASGAGLSTGADLFVSHAHCTPSDDIICVWKRIIILRHWLIKVRQGYRAREADEASLNEDDSHDLKSEESNATTTFQSDDNFPPKRFGDDINLEQCVVVPKTFNDLLKQVTQRAEFLCKLAPPSGEAERLKGDSQIALFNLAEKWSAQKTPPSLQPMLERWKTLGKADSSKWSGIVEVLRAQHRWRTRQASIQGLAFASPQSIANDSNIDCESSDDMLETKEYDYTNSFFAMMKACELYIRDGTGAPPEVLTMLLERRQRRSDSRLFGLQAIKSIISLLSYDSAIHNALIFLRPAMRGFTESEKESRELNDGQVVAETFRATVRHHYLKGLEGCNRKTIKNVQNAFCELYTHLAQLLGGSSGYSISDPQLEQTILCAWSLDFEPRDHQFLLDTGMLSKLQEIFSIKSILREAVAANADVSDETLSPFSLRGYSSINWHPVSEEFVQQGLLRSGYMTKRDVIRLLHRAPHYACSADWWEKNDMMNTRDGVPIIARHTASSLSLLYADMLAGLQRKLAGPPFSTPTCKVLLFGARIAPPSAPRGGQAATNPKTNEMSYVEMPALGEVEDFTMEMWIFPTELVGTQALRCDNGIEKGSVYLEIVGRHLQLSIPGNVPRERLFRLYQLQTFKWVHCAVTYDTEKKCLQLFVNGVLSEKMEFERVCSSVNFRPSRVGCWMSGIGTHGEALTNIFLQRKFKGSIAEVRIWKVSRAGHEILRDFQRSIPLVRYPTDLSVTKSQVFSDAMIGLWHLVEGEGICGYDSAPVLKAAIEGPKARGYNLTISHCRWVPTTIPVFGNDILDNMSPNEWSHIVKSIRVFQRKARSWLTAQFNESVRLAKLVCECDEHIALQKWNQLSRMDGDDGDVAVFDGIDAYLRGGQAERGGLTGHPLDTKTSKIISQWNACTDEQMIIGKQTRRCAWVVFRFIASTGISGAYDRREGEAKLVAAVAKMKRKQRLQKAGNVGNGISPTVGGLLSTEASRGSRLGFTAEDAATRTAEAASDAAKSAATNRELEEPVLQTLWFSKELHRKVFEVLEKELIQGKGLTEAAEGLTRAQRMLHSVSTPVQKRGASLRQYPSDIAHGKSRFVNIHHAPSDLSEESVLLEPLEVETHMFGVLLFMLSQSQQSPAITYLVRPHMLRGLLEMLRIASPRSQRVVKLLLRRICCSGSVKPSDVGAILGSESVLIDLLLDQVAESVCSTAAPMATHAVNVPASRAQIGLADKENSFSSSESLSNPIGFRSGEISLVMASESVALLRLLLMEKHWEQEVSANLCNAIRNITPILERKSYGPSSPAIKRIVDPSDIRIRAAIIRAVGALCVLGTYSDCIRIGGKVAVTAQGTNSSGNEIASGGSECSVSATLIEMSSHASTVRVVFHPMSSETNFDPSHNVQDVKLSTLSPTEEILLPSSVVPLSMDMMHVILQLTSLEETSVLKKFDSLWRLQIRSRALLALEPLLRHSVLVKKSFAHDAMAQNLLQFALAPTSLGSFLSLPLLQERGRMILCRLIESSTPLGEAMFHGLREPTSPALAASESLTVAGSSSIEVNDDPAEEETESHRVRRGFASTLAAMGFEFDLCMAALEHSRDDPNLAVEWLMGDGATTYQERLEAQRLVQARIVAHELADGADGTPGLIIEAKAAEVQSISGMPYCLALCAVELSNGDPNRAMEWLMEYGSSYAEKFDSLDLLTDAFVAARTVVLEDRAAMEDIDQPDPLVTSSGCQDATAVEYLGIAASTRSLELSYMPSADAMAVTLAPILAPVPLRPNVGVGARDVSVTAFSPLDPEYLTPNVLLTVTSESGPVQQSVANARTGIYRRYSPDDGVLISFLNKETGAYEDAFCFPRDLRRVVRIFDEPLEGVESIHRVAMRTENALSTYYARRAITALLCAFASLEDSTWKVPEMETDKAHIFDDKASSLAFSFTNEISNVVGGPRQFVNLLKMVSASEMNSIRPSVVVEGRTQVSSKSDNTEQPVFLLASLQKITLRMLREEARTEKFANSGVNSPRSRIAKRAEGPSDFSSEVPVCQPVPGVLEYNVGGDDDEAQSQATIEQLQAPVAPVTTAEARHDGWLDDESKSEDASKYMRISCQPSKSETQEFASGGVDDHDDLLSSVLVKECVSHFVESTRMAEDGAGEASAVQEFQSLHPYFGRSEYARAVSFDSSCRCLRIVFDHRCRLGPKSTLTFFANPECEVRIGMVDNAMTASGHLLPDLIIHSHQFWFRFTSLEEHATNDNGYGYRFQVKPMANIRWTKESEVLTSPSLEWACWVLELLLNDATELVAYGAVHNRNIYGALVRYLRSPGAPYKGRVVRLLQQLLHHSELFPVDAIPDLDALESISQLALTCAEVDRASGKMFLSAHLLQLVELSMMIFSAASVFECKLAGTSVTSAPLLTAPFGLPQPFERKRARDILNDVSVLTKFLLRQTTSLPQHILVAIWLEVYGSSTVIETSHPYVPGSQLNGIVAFEDAQSLWVTFDPRCSLAPGQGQTVSRLDLIVSHNDVAAEPTMEIRSNRTYVGESGWPENAISHDGNNLEYTFHADENAGAHFGFAATVSAVGIAREQQISRATVKDMKHILQRLVLLQTDSNDFSNGNRWTEAMDSQLVDWVNNHVEPAASLPSSTPTMTRHSVDLQPVDIKLNQTLDGLRCSQILNLPLESLQLRFSLLKYLNLSLQHCLSLLDLRDTKSPWTIAHRLRQLSHCIFFDVKSVLVDAAIEATNIPGETSGGNSQQQTARITLDRMQALESRDDREVEPSVSECFFAQAFRQLHQVDPALLRRQIDSKGRLFSVKFRGEEGVDWGGVYREGATSMVDDLFSPHFNLFVLCPNGQHDIGNNRGMYLPNPKCTSPVATQMFAFVGQLLGISLRTHGDFPFMLPSLVWKQLLGQTLTRDDLEDTDTMFIQMLDGIANCESDDISTEEEFATAFAGLELRFTASSCTGEDIELVPGGRHVTVGFHNRLEYCCLAELARLEECSTQVTAMAQGFATLFPRRVLTLLTWQELEILTCGSPKIDLDLWQRHTRYDGYSEDDPTVQLFWEALAEFSDEQRADFVRFAWGRSRLPRGRWPQPFKLSKKGGRDATRSLPVAHTCFFSVELPPYTSRETMRAMLFATITFGLGGILMA